MIIFKRFFSITLAFISACFVSVCAKGGLPISHEELCKLHEIYKDWYVCKHVDYVKYETYVEKFLVSYEGKVPDSCRCKDPGKCGHLLLPDDFKFEDRKEFLASTIAWSLFKVMLLSLPLCEDNFSKKLFETRLYAVVKKVNNELKTRNLQIRKLCKVEKNELLMKKKSDLKSKDKDPKYIEAEYKEKIIDLEKKLKLADEIYEEVKIENLLDDVLAKYSVFCDFLRIILKEGYHKSY